MLVATVIGEGDSDQRLIARIARGAGLPEGWLTRKRDRPGRDHAPSVAAARFADLSDLGVGDGVKAVQPGQGDLQRLARKGRLATRVPRNGDGLTQADIVGRRADSDLSASPLANPPGWRIASEVTVAVLPDQPDRW